MTSTRDMVASVVLFAGLAALYFAFDTYGLGIAFLGMLLFWVVLGIGTGYWVGRGADAHVVKLIEYLKEKGVIG